MKQRYWNMTVLVLIFFGSAELAEAQDYTDVEEKLSAVIRSELDQKGIPAAYIALVDGQSVVWKGAFGFADTRRKIPASTNDVYRIASVSKLFTDIAIMQLAERGELDLDAPVKRYLPDFRPRWTAGRPVTLRQIMTHRAGLVREPPVGNYMDPTEPTLEETVASLNQTELVYEPETRFKYSNAGIAVAGHVLQKVKGTEFKRYLEESLLKPMGLHESSFFPRPDLMARKPQAVLWTYDGRRMDVPTFQFGMAPAANMYSTLDDLGRFMVFLFNKGAVPGGRILREETLEEMWRPQFSRPDQTSGAGLGFFVDSFDGERLVSHSGDVYGFATEFMALPDRKLGVIVVNTLNACNDWSTRIARYALNLVLALKLGEPLPSFSATSPVAPELAAKIVGKYQRDPVTVEFFRRNDRLLMQGRTMQCVVRQSGDVLIVDDRHVSGVTIVPFGDQLIVGSDTLDRIPDAPPPPVPERWKGLIGEYGWDHSTLSIHERNGTLHALIEWYFSYRLAEISPDTFAFPDFGLYHGERLLFERGRNGDAVAVTAASMRFERRSVGESKGKTFRITPRRPVKELRELVLGSRPPNEQRDFHESDLVEVQKLDPSIRLDIKYATDDNFMGAVFYTEPRAFLQRPAAEAVARASQWLRQFGYGLLVYDGYRPWHVTKMFWEATPDSLRDFVADPLKGSRHNRGCAVDLGLYDLNTGKPSPMVSGYDEFSVRAYPDYPGGTSLERWNRELLRKAMEEAGFRVFEYEWWHFDFIGWERYPIMNLPFDQIQRGG
ncbi:MAG TPA: serine hydrolase [Bacteroidota bacterium]